MLKHSYVYKEYNICLFKIKTRMLFYFQKNNFYPPICILCLFLISTKNVDQHNTKWSKATIM
jgi:hypothetical protein